jgi:hypothetical protein
VNWLEVLTKKTNIVSREDDYVELRDDTLVPGFIKMKNISNGMT